MDKALEQSGLDQSNNINELSDLLTNSKIDEQHYDDTVTNYVFELKKHKKGFIPKTQLFYAAKLFQKCCNNGVTFENFKFIYTAAFHISFDPTDFGFTTDLEMFGTLADRNMISIRNQVMYTRTKEFDFHTFFKNNQINENESAKENLISKIMSSTPDVSLSVKSAPNYNLRVKRRVILGVAYDPSVFFLQYKKHKYEMDELSKNMCIFYEQENENVRVKPEFIVSGLIFVYLYKFNNIIQWRRIQILKEMDEVTVEVFHIDFGVVDKIPKSEIRFLKHKFSKLPPQVFHCCLRDYHSLNEIPREVTEAFFKMTVNKVFEVYIDEVKFLKHMNYKYKVHHVTLYRTNKRALYTNMNDDLTINHLAVYKAAKRYEAYKRSLEAGASDSTS